MNHKQHTATDEDSMEAAFIKLKETQGLQDGDNIPRAKLLQFLKTEGETFKSRDLSKYLAPLFGDGSEVAEEDTEYYNNLPAEIDVNHLLTSVLKMKPVSGLKTN